MKDPVKRLFTSSETSLEKKVLTISHTVIYQKALSGKLTKKKKE